MTLPYKSARTPGPLGVQPDAPGGGIPGPLRFDHVDLSKGAATKAVAKALAMPAPASGGTVILRARVVAWNLSKDAPRPEDVTQGELFNCPVAAILAALAHTASGRRRIDSMVTEYTGAPVKTTFSDDVRAALAARYDDPDYLPPPREIASSRYFSVALDPAVEVSDVFYTRYSDGADADLIYMGSPASVLWPCVIEKAYAAKVGGYQYFNDFLKHTITEFWPVLAGTKLQGFKVDAKTDVNKIGDAVKAATQVPTVAASNDRAKAVTTLHGFAVLGMQGSTIELWDPRGKKEKISLSDFRDNFQDIFFSGL